MNERTLRMEVLREILTNYHRVTTLALEMLDRDMQNSQRPVQRPVPLQQQRQQQQQRSQTEPNPLTTYSFAINLSDLFSTGGRNASTTSGFSPEQIQQIVRTIPYDASMNQVRCPILWRDFREGQNVSQIRSCGHVFDTESLQTWLQRNRRCPVCRCEPALTTTTPERSSSSPSSSPPSSSPSPSPSSSFQSSSPPTLPSQPSSEQSRQQNNINIIENFVEEFSSSFLNSFVNSFNQEVQRNRGQNGLSENDLEHLASFIRDMESLD